MLIVTNVLIGIVIVVLFCILDRLGDIFYSQTEEKTFSITTFTTDELKEFLDKLNDRED